MSRFIRKVFLYLTPLFIIISFCFVIDPYNYFNFFPNLVSKAHKVKAVEENRILPKLIKFNRSPASGLILGDSKINRLDEELVSSMIGVDFINMAYGGGSIDEAITTYWYCSKIKNLDYVFFALNFINYSESEYRDRVPSSLEVIKSPIKYLLSPYVIRSCLQIMKSLLKKNILNHEKQDKGTDFQKRSFWEYQLNVSAKKVYSQFKYPKSLFSRLNKISKDCGLKNTKLIFIIPPTHVDLQDEIKKYNLNNENIKFLNEINSIGKVYNFDLENDITKNRENFSDPFHFLFINQLIKSEILQNITNLKN